MVIKLEHTSGKIKSVFFVRIQFGVVKFVFNSLCVHFTTHEEILVKKKEAMDGARNKGMSPVIDRPQLASDRTKIIIGGQIDRPLFSAPI